MKTTIASQQKAMERLIIQACGARSITEYARACGISPMHVSRLKSGISKPSKKMCVKLSSDSYVKQLGISSEDFMKAAGYTDEVEIDCTKTFEKMINSWDVFVLGVISKKLANDDTKLRLVTLENESDIDFAFEGLDGSKIFFICCKAQKYLDRGIEEDFLYYYCIGRLMTLNSDEKRKYVFILDNEKVFQRVKQAVKDKIGNGHILLVLLDTVQMLFVKEEYLGTDKNFISLL